MALAQRLRAQGFHKEAAAEEDAARKDRPKFANEPRVVMGPNNKPMLVQMADDGTVRPIEGGYGVAEKLNFQGAGGNTLGLDPYTSEVKSTIKHTQSPDSIASNAIAIRGQNMTDARARELNAATAGNKPLTEFQGKATNFASRMTESDALVKKFEKAGINGSDFATIAAGSPLTNWAASEEGQMYRQAQENFVSANLRQESGAAIPKDEMNKEIRKYFPVVGDQPGVIAQKARARAIATKGMMVQAGPGAKSIGGIIAEDAAPSVAGAGAFSDASKEARYQEWKRSQNK
jgi:hypothetical protein